MDNIVKLISRSPKPFMDEYFRMRKDHKTDRDCYEALEEKIEAAIGIRRYSSFESFKEIKNRRK